MATTLFNLGVGTAKPTGGVQFGNKFFLTVEDHRPLCIMASNIDGSLKAYPAGIKAPTAAPTVADNIDVSRVNMAVGSTLTVAYAFFSSKRQTLSRLSPTASVVVGAQKIRISGFQTPRDGALEGDIDGIYIAVQTTLSGGGANPGLMVTDETILHVADFDFEDAQLATFDITIDDMEQGFNMSDADRFFEVPPAVKYVARYGERLWFAGQRRKVELDSAATVTVTKTQTFRGLSRAKLTLALGADERGWNDSHLHTRVFVDGKYLGDLFDFTSPTVAYLDVDVPASLAATPHIYLAGYNDRVYPSSWHDLTLGNIVTPFPESINLADRQILTTVLDEGEELKGLQAARDFLYILFQDTIQQLIDDKFPGSPAPTIRTDYGRTGFVAERSVALNPAGEVFGVGEEGPAHAATGGIASIAHELGINQFFKGGRWQSVSGLADIVACYSRQYDGYILGNLTVNGVAGFWALLSLAPQRGFFLMDGQAMTSNIIEYPDSNGQGVVLVGDAYRGRVKRLLDPDVLTDLAAAADTVAAYTCTYREGFAEADKGQRVSLTRVRLVGLVLPDASTLSLTLTLWGADYMVRNEADLDTTNNQRALPAITNHLQLQADLGFNLGNRRLHSLGFSWPSTAGANGVRPMEITRWREMTADDPKI